jgi:hypothetical protein
MCEKLTPRLWLAGREITGTGGLLGQCELAIDDRDIDLRLDADAPDLSEREEETAEGALCFEELREVVEP